MTTVVFISTPFQMGRVAAPSLRLLPTRNCYGDECIKERNAGGASATTVEALPPPFCPGPVRSAARRRDRKNIVHMSDIPVPSSCAGITQKVLGLMGGASGQKRWREEEKVGGVARD